MTYAFARRTPAHICDRTGNVPRFDQVERIAM
jgi:hypothetical protein